MFGCKLKKDYVSDFDAFFRAFDEKRTKLPPSRIKEVEKHKKIFDKRDNPAEDDAPTIWKSF
ncbi:hypothetical protein CC99x_008470 [Candidatus Berkiella cookevillensis]|uniref:Uncharacterized protein n=1 Tax=Candidatus Berkiella cookevillensis TaxID=437022 RepID=A0A0Q9YRW0_9GAMM|nr:CBU_0585 family protein [Candidatus Berkiella cookevillensis]MCS5708933.1 hypothetical protein [Candidatus Berkiella cookevillensis]